MGWRSVEANPAQWQGRLEHVFEQPRKLKPVVHREALPVHLVPELMRLLCSTSDMSAVTLRFVLLTVDRKKEVQEATWGEMDFDNAVWTIPAGGMKGRREHRVPLSKPALAILRERAKFCDTS